MLVSKLTLDLHVSNWETHRSEITLGQDSDSTGLTARWGLQGFKLLKSTAGRGRGYRVGEMSWAWVQPTGWLFETGKRTRKGVIRAPWQ